jgi:cyclophilin family peptidyl-prolyl cis-trans isomerase
VYFSISVDGKPLGRMVFRLRSDVVPVTAENFRQLCVSPNGYRGSSFHRVYKDFLIQGGDYTTKDGFGGQSIYSSDGGNEFPDENFFLKHSKKGILSMANCGADTNSSQFMILMKPAPWLNGKNVVYGHTIEGYELVEHIQRYANNAGEPTADITISACGEL